MVSVDISNQKFGRLTAIRPTIKTHSGWKWLCRCECGTEVSVSKAHLMSGHTKSCGCLLKDLTQEKSAAKGFAKSRLYHVWHGMKRRCEKPSDDAYELYGARGIKVCKEWSEDFLAFREWALSTGYDETAPKTCCTLDRIDNNGNYEPSNCRWVNMKTQSNNRRNNVNVTYQGETLTVAEWSDRTGLRHGTILGRLAKGWTIEDALTTRSGGQRNTQG